MSAALAMLRDADTAATSSRRSARGQNPAQRPTLGFGVPAETDPHHFIVRVPRGNAGTVAIVESLGLQARDHANSEILRVMLERRRWTAIRQAIQRVFNLRLKQHDLSVCRWRVGDNPVDRLLGRELCVLAWAVEQMPREDIPVAVRNWLALCPEERWWLFGVTALQAGAADDGDRGWRLALRHALGDAAGCKGRASAPTCATPPPISDLFGPNHSE